MSTPPSNGYALTNLESPSRHANGHHSVDNGNGTESTNGSPHHNERHKLFGAGAISSDTLDSTAIHQLQHAHNTSHYDDDPLYSDEIEVYSNVDLNGNTPQSAAAHKARPSHGNGHANGHGHLSPTAFQHARTASHTSTSTYSQHSAYSTGTGPTSGVLRKPDVATVELYPTPFGVSKQYYPDAGDGHGTDTITRNSTDMDGIEVDPAAFAKVFNGSVWDLLRSHPFLIFVSFFAALDGILFGYDTGVISGAIVFDGFRMDMSLPLAVPGQVDDSNTASTLGWIVASLTLGAGISSLIAGQMAHMIGRKPAIVIGAAISTIGGIVQASATDVGTLIAGRVVVGVGIGIVSTVVPIYVAEISPKSIRGSLGTLMNLFVTFGQLSAFCANLAFDKLSHQRSDWRWSLGIQSFIAFMLLLGLFALPESPRFLISKGQTERAKDVLRRLRNEVQVGQRIKSVRMRSDGQEQIEYESITNIDLEVLDVETEVSLYANQHHDTWLDLLRHRPYMFPLFIGVIIQLLQQFSGINAIMYYAPTIFSSLSIDRQVATVFTGIVNWLSNFITVILIDRIGRRPLLIWGGVLMTIACFVTAILIATTNPQNSSAAGSAVVALICIFIFSFAWSWGPVAWVLCSEIFPLSIRSKAIAATTMVNWLANFCVSKAVPSAIAEPRIGSTGIFLWFGFSAMIGAIFVFISVAETAGASLEQLDKKYGMHTWSQYREFCRRNILQSWYGKQWVKTYDAGDTEMEALGSDTGIGMQDSADDTTDDRPI